MALSVRRLAPGDEPVLSLLANADADFDVTGRGVPQQLPDPEVARRYLANPAVLHWVAFDDNTPVGSLYCIILPLDSGNGCELLLYDIGVHYQWRRCGVGRLLLAEMERWMHAHDVSEVWVLADNLEAAAFYQACGFVTEFSQPVYMTRSLDEAVSSLT